MSLSNIQQAVGNAVFFKTAMPVYIGSWDKAAGTLPSYTPTPWKVVSATSNQNGLFVQGTDPATGKSAVIRFTSLDQVSIPKASTWSDFMKTDYAKLLLGNILTSPGSVPAAVLQAAEKKASPILTIIRTAGEIVESAGDLAVNTLKAASFLASNIGTILLVLGGILLITQSGSGNKADYKRYLKVKN